MVVYGSALFAANQFMRLGVNADVIMNALSWVLEDEEFISIRKKEDDSSTVSLSAITVNIFFLCSVFVVPLAIAIAGVVIWLRRRRL